MKSRFSRIIILITPLILAFVLYSYSLFLPLFNDDVYNLYFLNTLDGLQQWGGSPSFPYYRPMVFTVWKGAELLFGARNAFALHTMNVFFFGMTGTFVVWLVQRTIAAKYPKWLIGSLAGCAFVLFPFNYQAVALVSSLFHILLAWGLLGCMLGVIRWLDTRHPGWLIAGWVCGLIGVFSHENGFLLAPLLLIALFLAARQHREGWTKLRTTFAVSIPLFLSVLYLVLWFTVPRAREQATIVINTDPVEWIKITANLLQGAFYPAAALLRPLFPASIPPVFIIGLGILVIVVLLILVWRAEKNALAASLAGLLWYGLATAPVALLFNSVYVENSPRLLLLASIGLSWLWGVGLAIFWRHYPRARWIITVFGMWTLVVCLHFARWRAIEYTRMGRYTWELFQLAETLEPYETGVTLINVPNYIGPKPAQQTFLIGAENGNFMTNEMNYGHYFWMNTHNDLFLTMLTIQFEYVPWVINYSGGVFVPHISESPGLYTQLKSGTHLFTTAFTNDDFYPVYIGRSGIPSVDTRLATFGLEPASLWLQTASAALSDNQTEITLYLQWRVIQPAPMKRFLHIFCDGELVGQNDGYPWASLYPFADWEVNETQGEFYTLRLSRDVRPECLDIKVGVYTENDGQRLIVINPVDDSEFLNGLVPIPLVDNNNFYRR